MAEVLVFNLKSLFTHIYNLGPQASYLTDMFSGSVSSTHLSDFPPLSTLCLQFVYSAISPSCLKHMHRICITMWQLFFTINKNAEVLNICRAWSHPPEYKCCMSHGELCTVNLSLKTWDYEIESNGSNSLATFAILIVARRTCLS